MPKIYVYDVLSQDQVWTDRDGIVHTVATMDANHAAACAGLLWQRRRRLHDAFCWSAVLRMPNPDMTGDMAMLSLEQDMDELFDTSPDEWIQTTPLYRALKQRAEGIPL